MNSIHPLSSYGRHGFMGDAIDCSPAETQAVIQNVQAQSQAYIQQLIPLIQAVSQAKAQVNFYSYAQNNVLSQYKNLIQGQVASIQQLYPVSSLLPGINYAQATETGTPYTWVYPWNLVNPNNPNDTSNTFPIGNRPVMPSNPDAFTTNYVTMLQNVYDTLLPYAQQYANITAQLTPAQNAYVTANTNLNNLQNQIAGWASNIIGQGTVINPSYYIPPSPYLACLTGIPISLTDLITAANNQITQIQSETPLPNVAPSMSATTPVTAPQDSSSAGDSIPGSTPVVQSSPVQPVDLSQDSQAIQTAANIPASTQIVAPPQPAPVSLTPTVAVQAIDQNPNDNAIQAAASILAVPVTAPLSPPSVAPTTPVVSTSAPTTSSGMSPLLIAGGLLALFLVFKESKE